jgi:restriction endonuclease S subunit
MNTKIKFDKYENNSEIASYTNLSYVSIMSSVENFRSAIIRIRDILRGPGMAITGMDSMRHICLYILSRYVTKDKAKQLNIPEECCWESFIDMITTQNGGKQKALDLFYHPDLDNCLIRHFDRLFGTSDFPFTIKNINKHAEIMEILDKVNINIIDTEIDILGWIYEQHLKTGSSTGGRDLGQFFTDRSICKYMTELCRPGFKSKGVPETVCDPSMGTGGFLSTFVKYYQKYYPNDHIDWTIQEKQLYGCDTDSKVAGIARLNLFMEMGGCRTTNLLTHDSLYGDLPITGYDIILANMPFGLKGLTHAECCERVKKLKFIGTKSEPLFLQLMMVSLNKGGRCAVVVPDGMLVNSSKCHDNTRKHLLEHFELKRVIKMKGQFFMNTGIQPSILFFENTGKPTKAVEFWETVKDDKGQIIETMIVSVPHTKIMLDNSYSLDMRRYMESEKHVVNPAGFPMVKLEEVVSLKSGKLNTNRGANYSVPYYCSNGVIGYVETHTFDGEYVITALDLSIGAVHYMSGKFATSQHAINLTSLDKERLNNRYMYYWLKLNNNLLKNMSKGIKPGILRSDVANLQMPLPPLPIQQEIVATLDRIYNPGTIDLADTIKMTDKAMDLVLANPAGMTLEPIVEAQRLIRKSAQMIADIKAQMMTIMKSVGRRGFSDIIISEKCSMMIGGTPLRSKSEYYENGQHIWVSVSELNNNVITTSKELINDLGVKNSNVKLVKKGSVLMSFKLSIGKCAIAGTDLYTNEAIVAFHSNTEKELLNKYLYYYLCTYDFSNSGKGSLGAGSMNKSSLSELTIPLPPIDFQHSLITRLDALQSQLTSLENLQKQSEDNARFILESYLNTSPLTNEIIENTHKDNDTESVVSEETKPIVKRKRPTIGAHKSD